MKQERGRHDRWSIYRDSLVGRAELEGPTGAAGLGRGGALCWLRSTLAPRGKWAPKPGNRET